MKFLLMIFTVVLSLNITAQDSHFSTVANASVLSHKLDSLSKNVKSIRSDFIQTKHISVLEEEIISKGRFIFLKPANIKWSYMAPVNYEISIVNGTFKIMNDGKVSEYDVQSNKMFSEINGMIISMLNGSILSDANFEVNLLENNTFYKAVLKPKSKDFQRFIIEIHIYFAKKDFMVSKIKMVEASGDFTLIKFYNRIIDKNVSLKDLGFEN